LTINVRHRVRDIAAAEPHAHLITLHQHRRIADDFRIPLPFAGEDAGLFLPCHAIA
jgi:hypothetical protein